MAYFGAGVGMQACCEVPVCLLLPPVTRQPTPAVALPQPKLTWQVDVQPFASVTDKLKMPAPEVPAVYVMVCEFVPAVIVQPALLPVSDQLYDTEPAGPLSVLPVEPQLGSGFGTARLQTVQLAVIV